MNSHVLSLDNNKMRLPRSHGFLASMKGVYHLKGAVKHYDWGGYSFIPGLLNETNREKKPFAEYWLGIHQTGEAGVKTNEGDKKLSALAPDLPYLLKLLDVREMLSIQVHPSKDAARLGFERENAAGIPIDSPVRNFKDPNHKPELMVALGDFWLLHGFKPEKELAYTLLNVLELRGLLQVFRDTGYDGLYKHVMEMAQEEVNSTLKPLIENLSNVYSEIEADKDDEDYWVMKAAKSFASSGNIDRGIFSIFLLNLVHLKHGEGIYQAAGVPHAYLEGQNVEIMANSDNVLRGGLTNKHINVDELLKHIHFEGVFPNILTGEVNDKNESIFQTSANDFQLSVFELKESGRAEFVSAANEILLVTSGSARVICGEIEIEIGRGKPSALILPDQSVQMKSVDGATVFRASNPPAIS